MRYGQREDALTPRAEVCICRLYLQIMGMLTLTRDMLFTTDKSRVMIENAVDNYGDSYARDITGGELKGVRFLNTGRD